MAFTIDKIRRITSYAATKTDLVEKDDILYTIKDVSGFSISNGAETEDAVDGQGNIIETYLRSKTAEMSGENAIFDMPLAATMVGAKLGEKGKVAINFHDILDVKATKEAVELSHNPTEAGAPKVVYVVNGDGTLGAKLEATEGFTYTEAGEGTKATVTLTEAIKDKDGAAVAGKIFVPYVYEEESALKFENFADAATIPSRVVVEGLGRDVCDHHQVYFYITAPYAELAYDNEFGFSTDATYSFTLNCKKPYCEDTGLYAVIVVDAE